MSNFLFIKAAKFFSKQYFSSATPLCHVFLFARAKFKNVLFYKLQLVFYWGFQCLLYNWHMVLEDKLQNWSFL